MAGKIKEKLELTRKFDVECTLNIDELQEGVFIGEVEEEGEVDLFKYLRKFNGKYVKLSLTEKTAKDPTEDEE